MALERTTLGQDFNARTRSNSKTVLGFALLPKNVVVIGGLLYASSFIEIVN